MFNYSFPNLFFFASNFKIKYYCFYAKNVCKPNRFFFSHCSCLDFLPERDINCNILNHIFPCFADSGYSTAAYPPGPSPVFYCCYYFRPPVRVFDLGWSWIPCPRYTQNFICRREMCRWQAIFIHFSHAGERRAVKPSTNQKWLWPWNSCANFSFSLVKCYYYIKFWAWAVLTSVL